jgi:hypothetical protein
MALVDPLDPTPDFVDSYNHLMMVLEGVHRGTEKDRTFDELRDYVSERLVQGFTANQLGQAYVVRFGESRSICQLFEASVAYAGEALDAYRQIGIDAAWPRLTFAYYFLGMATITERSVRAAFASTEPHEQFKTKIVELLEEKCPPGLWDSPEKARGAILPDFLDFYERLPPDEQAVLEDPEGSLRSWSNKALRAEFRKHVKEIRRGRPKGSRNLKA